MFFHILRLFHWERNVNEIKENKETREDKAKRNLPFMTRLDSNVYKPFFMLFKSFQFSSKLCFLQESSFEARSRMKIFISFKFQ